MDIWILTAFASGIFVALVVLRPIVDTLLSATAEQASGETMEDEGDEVA